MNGTEEFKKRPLNADEASEEWEVRPGGMLVQKRDPHADAVHAGPLINLRVSYGRMYHHVSIAANSTFGDLKKALVQDTRLQPRQQRLQYKGKERNDKEVLREVGVKDKAKVILVEDVAGSEKRLIEMRKADAVDKARKAVAEVQEVVDKLSGQVVAVESAINQGKKLSEREITGLIDVLMCQLLKLDASKVSGDADVKKRILVRRIQKYVEKLDVLLSRNNCTKSQNDVSKTRNSSARVHFDSNTIKHDPVNNLSKGIAPDSMSKATALSTVWENFGTNCSTKVTPKVAEPLLIQWD